jgi:hypothetical protein
MRKTLTSILIAFALIVPTGSIAGGSKSPKLAKCNGSQRRPANPYGSILPTVDPVTGTSIPASQPQDRRGVEVFPKDAPAPKLPKPADMPEAQVPPISEASPLTPYRSC